MFVPRFLFPSERISVDKHDDPYRALKASELETYSLRTPPIYFQKMLKPFLRLNHVTRKKAFRPQIFKFLRLFTKKTCRVL